MGRSYKPAHVTWVIYHLESTNIQTTWTILELTLIATVHALIIIIRKILNPVGVNSKFLVQLQSNEKTQTRKKKKRPLPKNDPRKGNLYTNKGIPKSRITNQRSINQAQRLFNTSLPFKAHFQVSWSQTLRLLSSPLSQLNAIPTCVPWPHPKPTSQITKQSHQIRRHQS